MKLGLIGLVQAARKFDSDKGMTFSTFAVPCIRNAICFEYRKSKAVSRKSNENVLYLSSPSIDGEEGTELGNIIPDDFDMEEHIEKIEERELLNRAISSLQEREQLAIKYYYFNNLNQEEIAKLIGTSQANASRILNKALNKLRKYMNEDEMYSKYRRNFDGSGGDEE